MKHLKDINMSWSIHLWYAMTLAMRLFLLSLTALVHGMFPFIFISTVSDGVNQLKNDLDQRNHT